MQSSNKNRHNLIVSLIHDGLLWGVGRSRVLLGVQMEIVLKRNDLQTVLSFTFFLLKEILPFLKGRGVSA